MRTMLEKIDYSNPKNKEKMNDYFDMLMEYAEDNNEELYDHINCEIYEIVHGKTITDEMAEEWVKGLVPMGKWTKDEVSSVAMQYGVDIPLNCAYVIMNMLYSDYKDVYGSGDDEDSINEYIKGLKDFYYDEDSKYKGEEKLYEYKKTFVKWD